MYQALAIGALLLHLTFILWVIFGTLLTRGRPLLAGLHIASLLYAIFIEITLLPCPLTALEQWAQRQSGQAAYEGAFLAHYLEKLIYPDVPLTVLVPAAVAVCLFNLAIYAYRWRQAHRGL